MVYARCPAQDTLPPVNGWHVPPDGPLRECFRIEHLERDERLGTGAKEEADVQKKGDKPDEQKKQDWSIYEGVVEWYNKRIGYGFIECHETHVRYNRDVHFDGTPNCRGSACHGNRHRCTLAAHIIIQHGVCCIWV